jgi:hypothetical protein
MWSTALAAHETRAALVWFVPQAVSKWLWNEARFKCRMHNSFSVMHLSSTYF